MKKILVGIIILTSNICLADGVQEIPEVIRNYMSQDISLTEKQIKDLRDKHGEFFETLNFSPHNDIGFIELDARATIKVDGGTWRMQQILIQPLSPDLVNYFSKENIQNLIKQIMSDENVPQTVFHVENGEEGDRGRRSIRVVFSYQPEVVAGRLIYQLRKLARTSILEPNKSTNCSEAI